MQIMQPRHVTISVRLTKAEYLEFLAACKALRPANNPTNVTRWLIAEWTAQQGKGETE